MPNFQTFSPSIFYVSLYALSHCIPKKLRFQNNKVSFEKSIESSKPLTDKFSNVFGHLRADDMIKLLGFN